MISLPIIQIGHFLALGVKFVTLVCAFACVSSTILPNNIFANSKQASDDAEAWNLFSVGQDIQLGNESATRFEKAVQLVQDPKLNGYFAHLGDRLTSTLPQDSFPFSFKLVADGALHAFSFPGGPVYCTAGMMAAAESEAQLAGLVAHQIAHIILRDATSKASRMKRFRVRAAMVVASTGEKSLLESLEEIDLYLIPSSQLMHFDTDSERLAIALAAKLMVEAGYEPREADIFFRNLQINHGEVAAFYLSRHLLLNIDDPTSSQTFQGKTSRVVSKRKFRRLRNKAAAIQVESVQLESLVNWRPPERKKTASTGSRITYLTSSYSFSYPAAWRQANSIEPDRFQVSPKGDAVRLANGEDLVTAGVIAGVTDPVNHQAKPGKNGLLELVGKIRPGLAMVGELEHVAVDSRAFEGIILEGLSPVSGEREMAWMVRANLIGRVFYLLMVAPNSVFQQLQPEFDAILASINFSGHPLKGQMDVRSQDGVPSQDGTVIQPQVTE